MGQMRNNLPTEGLIKDLEKKRISVISYLHQVFNCKISRLLWWWVAAKHLLCSAVAAGRSDHIIKLETFPDLNVQKTKHIWSFLPCCSVSSLFFNKNSQPVITINSCRQFRVLMQLTCITLCGWKLMWIQRRKYNWKRMGADIGMFYCEDTILHYSKKFYVWVSK